MSVRRSLPVALIALVALLVGAVSASANDLGVLDAKPASPGNVEIDGAGNAYVAWTSDVGTGTAAVIFCKIPAGGSTCSTRQTLPLPPAPSSFPDPSGAFPVLGPGNTVYVVAPRYVNNDLAIWKSEDGGATFGAPVASPDGYSNKTDPSDVILKGSSFLVGAHNAGLGFSTSNVGGGAGEKITFEEPGVGGVGGSSMDVDSAGNPVTAYWNLAGPPYPILFYDYKGSGLFENEANWSGPTLVANGYEPRLASGPSGLFMASQDYPDGGGPYPTVVHVRKYAGGSFGAPLTLAADKEIGLFYGGAIDESADGSDVAVIWPGLRGGDNASVMRLYLSTSGGSSFNGESDVALIGTAYGIGDNAEVAVGSGGNGWATFIDANGLHLADFAPVAPVKPEKYKGKEKVADKKKAGAFDLTLRLPKQCVQSNQAFFAGVGKRKRKGLSKKLGGKIKFTSVVFVFDGKKLKVKKTKPFRYLIEPGPMAAGSSHVVKTKVTALLTKSGKAKKIKRTLKGSIKAC